MSKNNSTLLFVAALFLTFAPAFAQAQKPATAPQLKPAPKQEAAPGYRQVADIKELTIDWSKVAEVRPGVQVERIATTGEWHVRPLHQGPRQMKIVVMRVKMQGLTFTGTPRDKDWGQPMPDFPKGIIRTLRTRTADFMNQMRQQGREMIVGSNTAPWSPWQSPFTHRYANPSGIQISDGVVVTDNRNSYRAIFVVWKDGRMEVREELKPEEYPNVWLAHSGFGLLLKDNKDMPGGNYERALMPRMAAGFTPDQKYLLLVTIDGRQPGWSDGAFGHDLQRIFRAAGANDAIDFDGGGSATLCYWNDAKKKAVMLNRHNKGGYARPCGMNWGLYRK